MKNLELLKEHVSVNRNDMEGLMACDNNDMKNVHTLCEAYGIDLTNHFLLGFGFSFGEMRGNDTLQKVECHVLILDQKYGTNHDEVVKNVKKENVVKVEKKYFTIPFEALGIYLKRFETTAIVEIGNYIKAIEITE